MDCDKQQTTDCDDGWINEANDYVFQRLQELVQQHEESLKALQARQQQQQSNLSLVNETTSITDLKSPEELPEIISSDQQAISNDDSDALQIQSAVSSESEDFSIDVPIDQSASFLVQIRILKYSTILNFYFND